MGVSPSECIGLRKKETYIHAIKLDRHDDYEQKKMTSSKASKSTRYSKPPKTPMDLLFPPPQSNTPVTSRSITADTHISNQAKKPREGLEDINTQNVGIKQSLIRPPELKKISKIESASWSPIKA
jgi:hypothetical protein